MGKSSLLNYSNLVGDKITSNIIELAKKHKGIRIAEINTTKMGGGVAAMLMARKKIYKALGINWQWYVVEGGVEFSDVVKKFFNALQGEDVKIGEEELLILTSECENFVKNSGLENSDIIIVHDNIFPLIDFFIKRLRKGNILDNRRPKFIWRSHMDTSNPNLKVWNLVKNYVNKYDCMVTTLEEYAKSLTDFSIPVYTIFPAIDPLDEFNRPVSKQEVDKTFSKLKLFPNQKIIVKISRFDKWKGYSDLIVAFKELKQENKLDKDTVLILIGETAKDDPEGIMQLKNILKLTDTNRDIKILLNGEVSEDISGIYYINIQDQNVLQWKADIIVHVPYAAGFEMSITSSLWKARPVIASNVGGIPEQVRFDLTAEEPITGFLIPKGRLYGNNRKKIDKIKQYIMQIVNDPDLSKKIGQAAKDHVLHNFLITNVIRNWFKIFNNIL